MNTSELNKMTEPLEQAKYKHIRGRPIKEKKLKWSDRITCKICGKTYLQSNSTWHKKSNFHKLHEKLNDKMREIFILNKNV